MSLSVEEVFTREGLAALAPAWRGLWERCPGATVFQSPGWLLAWSAHLLEGEPRLLAFWRRGELAGVAPFFTWRGAAGGERLLSLMGAGVSDRQDVLFRPDERGRCHDALAAWLARRTSWDRAEWSEIADGSPLLELGSPPAAAGEPEVCPGLPLAGAAATVLEAVVPPGMFERVQYARRRAARVGGLTVETADAASFPRLWSELERLHATRWRARGQEGALAEGRVRAFHRAVAALLLARGSLMLHAVHLDGRVAAVLHGFHDRDATRYYVGGFDPAAARLSPGTLAIAHGIEAAAARGSRLFDFLRGAEPYKYRWGARDLTRLHRRVLPAPAR